MKTKTQNPYADVVIDGTPPFIVRHGMLLILAFLLLCFFVGMTIKVPGEKKFISTIELMDNKVADTIKCSFSMNANEIGVFKNNEPISFAISNVAHSRGKVNGIVYAVYPDKNTNDYEVVANISGTDNVKAFLEIYNNPTHECYIISEEDKSLSEYIFESLFFLFDFK